MHTLGQTIKRLRENMQLSQKDFAQQLGISNVVLSRYESDIRKPDYDTLQKIADIFDVSIDYLFGRKNKNTNDEVFSTNLTAIQQEVLQFFVQLDEDTFIKKPEDLLDALEQFELYYAMYKMQKARKNNASM